MKSSEPTLRASLGMTEVTLFFQLWRECETELLAETAIERGYFERVDQVIRLFNWCKIQKG